MVMNVLYSERKLPMSTARMPKFQMSIRLQRKLEHFRREAIVYGVAVLAFTFVMYLVTSEVAREALAFGR